MPKDKYIEITKEIILNTIDRDNYSVFLFGSRAERTYQFNSDVYIGILGGQPLGKHYYEIVNDLENSIIPYKVEIANLYNVNEEFKNNIFQGNIIIWNKGKYLR